ncbi:D-cysteine desulfhydrase family protein [Arenibacter sp. M-2]|uniref:D-cysteine desulfhydrase family protein n=1 Tax=Arenibacter sp. M-2 TaxID=3053612 RepID=UPI002570F5B2|nr:D-cysteine desulfhydrase family protein [Arenibacter sp. M-2]MDL5512519.1 D-cysteine desulfhydrase family protein [Arenibacter sp. M-2]
MLTNKFNLGFFPTPLHELQNMSKSFPAYSIFIKRDDLTGLACGGNKTRKLEFLIKQALDGGYNTIITSGAQQSNHCRQTAAACAMAGLKCHLLLGGDEPQTYTGNLLLSSILGAQIHFTGNNRKGEDTLVLKKELEKKNNRCFVIPYGGSNIIGALGFIIAVKELKKQLKDSDLTIDYIFFPSSSGGMQAGLTLGIEYYNLNYKLIPINVDKDQTNGRPLEKIVLEIINEGFNYLKMDKQFGLTNIPLNKDYDKDGYGNLNENEKNTILELAQQEGIILDPVYSGRAFNGMIDILKSRKIPEKSNVLFWHTGGGPAIFDYSKPFTKENGNYL